tara:strand:+ start:108 stop:389 length:282 start_codon:yes stop_codon:yes gene_type:complete
MRKEFVVVRIDAAPDAAPYVVVSLSSKKDVQESNGPLSSPFGKANVMGFTNMNDMAKELNKMMTGGGVWNDGQHYLHKARHDRIQKTQPVCRR